MIGLHSQYGLNLVLSVSVVLVSTTVAILVALHRRNQDRPAIPLTAHVLTAGSAALIVAATALPNRWPIRWAGDGDLVLQPGMGGLRSWTAELARFPETLASILLVANVTAYVPLGFFAVIGWGTRRSGRILVGILGLSVAIELMQYLGLGRVAATDDVILNMLGGAAGLLLGRLFLRIRPVDRANPSAEIAHPRSS